MKHPKINRIQWIVSRIRDGRGEDAAGSGERIKSPFRQRILV